MELPAAPQVGGQQLDLNHTPLAMDQDLNMAPIEESLEMIINPAQQNVHEEEELIDPPPPLVEPELGVAAEMAANIQEL